MTNVMYTPLTKEESEEAVLDSERKELEVCIAILVIPFNCILYRNWRKPCLTSLMVISMKCAKWSLTSRDCWQLNQV